MFGIRFDGEHQVIQSEQLLWVCNFMNGKNSSFCFAVTYAGLGNLQTMRMFCLATTFIEEFVVTASLRQEMVIKTKL